MRATLEVSDYGAVYCMPSVTRIIVQILNEEKLG